MITYIQEPYRIPILFIFFCRLEIALRSFEEIRKIKPQKLYLACDGVRPDHLQECDTVNNLRSVILDRIDWNCEVKTLFQENNLGCGLGVYTAINWLFANEEIGVILEDDCIVNSSFFKFMEEMLYTYASDYRIGMIAGTNPVELPNYPYSYLFSNYKSCWGWGTWRRAWSNMDLNMVWRKIDARSILNNCGRRGKDIDEWIFKIKEIDKGHVSAWDWQWYFSTAAQNQLCIYPVKNLVTNIGNDSNATHTAYSSISIPSYQLEFPLSPPPYIVPQIEFENKFAKKSLTVRSRLTRLLPYRMRLILKKYIKYLYHA